MSIIRRITFVCDDCGEEEETGTDDFSRARDHIRSLGWVTRKDGDEWLNFCGECANDHRR